jgi:membrane dipeptidase
MVRPVLYRIVLLLIYTSTAWAQISERARELHENSLVFDAHVHVINREFYNGGDIGQRLEGGQFDLPRAREGGLGALFFTLFTRELYYPGRFETKQTLRLLDLAHDQLQKNRETIEVALNASDIERIHKQGKIAAVMALEGSFDLDGDLGVLRELYRLGLRSIQLASHNWTNNYADSCCAPPKWHGLNDHGRAVVREMNRLGIVVDVSHSSEETIAQVIEISSDPIVTTHHGLRSFNDIPRNMSDDLLKKLAAKGGVMAFHIGNEFHNPRQFEWRTKHQGGPFWEKTGVTQKMSLLSIAEIDQLAARKSLPENPTSPDDVLMSPDEWVSVVDHAIQLVGENHVALGSDFDGGPTMPRGMRDVRDLPMITDAMLRRGYSEERIRKFLGGNLLRVFRQVTEKKP